MVEEQKQLTNEEPLDGLIGALRRERNLRRHRGFRSRDLSHIGTEEIFQVVTMIEANPKSVLAIKDEDGKVVGFTLAEEKKA